MASAASGQGVPLAEILIRLLCYADDVAIAEYGDSNGIQRIEDRVNCISRGSKEDADMQVNIERTVALHVRARAQDQVSATNILV